MIAIIDYGIGNLGSVKNAFDSLGIESKITSDKNEILSADKVILPGVGAFGDAINTFRAKGFDVVIDEIIKKNTPLLGICVGMQILFDGSYEYGYHKGLGVFEGDFVKFDTNKDNVHYKIPHMGWNDIKVLKDNKLIKDLKDNYVYFVHSYYMKDSKDALCYTEYAGQRFVSAVCRGNIYATQFHPEKSGEVGLNILKNFGSLK